MPVNPAGWLVPANSLPRVEIARTRQGRAAAIRGADRGAVAVVGGGGLRHGERDGGLRTNSRVLYTMVSKLSDTCMYGVTLALTIRNRASSLSVQTFDLVFTTNKTVLFRKSQILRDAKTTTPLDCHRSCNHNRTDD